MTTRAIVALAAGAVTTIAAFTAAMLLLIFGGYFADHERLVYVSIALGPVAMLAVMLGYAVWWMVLFLLSLVLSTERPPQDRTPE
jgi:hypothetical protein